MPMVNGDERPSKAAGFTVLHWKTLNNPKGRHFSANERVRCRGPKGEHNLDALSISTDLISSRVSIQRNAPRNTGSSRTVTSSSAPNSHDGHHDVRWNGDTIRHYGQHDVRRNGDLLRRPARQSPLPPPEKGNRGVRLDGVLLRLRGRLHGRLSIDLKDPQGRRFNRWKESMECIVFVCRLAEGRGVMPSKAC